MTPETHPDAGIFDFRQLNSIRDAHRAWCDLQSIDPSSPLGQETAAMMFERYRNGGTSTEELMAACDAYVTLRRQHGPRGTH